MEGAAHAETYRALGAGFLEQRHGAFHAREDRKSTRLNSSHSSISYAVFCLKKKKDENNTTSTIRIIINTSYKVQSPITYATMTNAIPTSPVLYMSRHTVSSILQLLHSTPHT